VNPQRPSCTVTCGPRPQCRRGPFAQRTQPTALPGRPVRAVGSQPVGTALGTAQYRCWRSPRRGRGGSGVRSRAEVAGRILALADGEVDRGRRLGQHGEVGSSIGVSRGGVAHRRGLSTAVLARRRSSPVLGRRSGGWRRWSS
jgi:hypothetical protein